MVKLNQLRHFSRSQRQARSTLVDQRRFYFIFILFLTLFLALIARLFYWQVIKAEELSHLAKKQYQRQVV